MINHTLLNMQDAGGEGWIKLTEIFLKDPDRLDFEHDLEFGTIVYDIEIKDICPK